MTDEPTLPRLHRNGRPIRLGIARLPAGHRMRKQSIVSIQGYQRVWMVMYQGLFCAHKLQFDNERMRHIRPLLYTTAGAAMAKARMLNKAYNTDRYVVHRIETTALVTEAVLDQRRKAVKKRHNATYYQRNKAKLKAKREAKKALAARDFWQIVDYAPPTV
jgi:hypothetical protein